MFNQTFFLGAWVIFGKSHGTPHALICHWIFHSSLFEILDTIFTQRRSFYYRCFILVGSWLFFKSAGLIIQPTFSSVVPEKLIKAPGAIRLKCTIHFIQSLRVAAETVHADCSQLSSSPGAVKESHPRGATPGHRWWMEPKGRGALAVRPSLKAVIAATIRQNRRRH